jgi:type II secretory pathway component GspD/PulD (secretin)
LKFSNAEEMAEVITNVFQDQSRTNQRRFGRRRFFGPPPQQQEEQSRRQQEEITVVATPDSRTNSVIVKAATETMGQIERMIEQLDADPAKDRKVFIYSMENADPEKIKTIMEEMFEGQSTTRRSTTNQRNTNRQTSTRNTRQGSSNNSGNTR